MQKGVLLFCFDTADTKYHRVLETCVALVKKNLGLDVTVVTDLQTFKMIKPLGFVNYKLIDRELGNTKNKKEWRNRDRHMAYELSPYDCTLLIDIDYFPFTDNLRQLMDTGYDFLVSKEAYDLSGRNSFDHARFSVIDMVWATVIIFRKTEKAKRIFDMVKYVKKYYAHFNKLYRVRALNFRNDYAFAIALQHANGFMTYDTMPISLPTLPPDCKVLEIGDRGLSWKYDDQVMFTEDQDVHVLNKEIDV